MSNTLFPSILPGNEPFADTKYTKGEIESKSYQELRSIAAQHPSEDVHGKQSKKALKENLVGLERV